MKGPMHMVVLRIDKTLPKKANVVHLGMRKVMSIPDLLALGVARNMRMGVLPVEMVAMSMVTVVT